MILVNICKSYFSTIRNVIREKFGDNVHGAQENTFQLIYYNAAELYPERLFYEKYSKRIYISRYCKV